MEFEQDDVLFNNVATMIMDHAFTHGMQITRARGAAQDAI